MSADLPVALPVPAVAEVRRAGLQRRPDDPAYAPGPIRAATDALADTVGRFCHRHPEYAKLGSDAIVQAMTTFRTDEEADLRKVMADEGVPVDVLCGFRPADPLTDEENV